MSDFKGLVLSNTILKEADVILTILTDEGKVSLKARGVLKPNAKNRSMTEVGCYSMFHTIDTLKNRFSVLKSAEMVERFHFLDDLVKKSIYDCLLEGFHKSDIILSQALDYIHLLESCQNPYCLYGLFLGDCLKQQGIELISDECACCHSKKGLCSLSLKEGGFVCENCFQEEFEKRLSVEQLKNIRYLMHASVEKYSILEECSSCDFETVNLIYMFLQHYGEFILKSHRFLEVLQPLV